MKALIIKTDISFVIAAIKLAPVIILVVIALFSYFTKIY